MQPKPVPQYTFEKEAPITAPIIKKVVGPDAESVSIAFRLPGNQDKDALLADLVGEILINFGNSFIRIEITSQYYCHIIRYIIGLEVLANFF